MPFRLCVVGEKALVAGPSGTLFGLDPHVARCRGRDIIMPVSEQILERRSEWDGLSQGAPSRSLKMGEN